MLPGEHRTERASAARRRFISPRRGEVRLAAWPEPDTGNENVGHGCSSVPVEGANTIRGDHSATHLRAGADQDESALAAEQQPSRPGNAPWQKYYRLRGGIPLSRILPGIGSSEAESSGTVLAWAVADASGSDAAARS